MKIGIIVSRFNLSITQALLDGALGVLGKADVMWVPGAFELPIAAQKMAQSGLYEAIICLGSIIRGDTPHFDIISQTCAAGIMQVSLDEELPILMGVLTTDTLEQAQERAGLKPYLSSIATKPQLINVGENCAKSALELLQSFLSL